MIQIHLVEHEPGGFHPSVVTGDAVPVDECPLGRWRGGRGLGHSSRQPWRMQGIHGRRESRTLRASCCQDDSQSSREEAHHTQSDFHDQYSQILSRTMQAEALSQGDTPIQGVLQLLKRERWPIPAYIEYEYRGDGTPVEEVKRCYAYAKHALA